MCSFTRLRRMGLVYVSMLDTSQVNEHASKVSFDVSFKRLVQACGERACMSGLRRIDMVFDSLLDTCQANKHETFVWLVYRLTFQTLSESI